MRYKKLFLSSTVLFVLFSLLFVGSVEASSEMWSQTYVGEFEDIAYSLVEASDGGFALAGWRRPSWGEHSDFWLVKTDAYGNMIWNRTFGGEDEETAYALVETSDGGYAVAGFTKSFGAGLSDFWLVKTDANGNEEWNRTYGGTKKDYAHSLVITSDGGYALAGYTNSFGADGFNFLLIKTDGAGNVEWTQTYGGANHEEAFSLVETSDEGFALAGYTNSFGAGVFDFWLVKTDANGNMLWNRKYGGKSSVDWAFSLVETSDEGFALGGWKQSSMGFISEFLLVKTDSYGNMLWNQTYDEAGYDVSQSLIETSDGGFALVGNNRLVKTDEYGNLEWTQTYEEGNPNSLVEVYDGGYVLAGEIIPYDSERPDFWLAKTDEHGCIPEFHPPYICVDSPQNITYTTTSVSLNFTVNEETSWMGYSLDGQDNITITENTLILTELADGSHNITVYATDTDGNTAASETISFTIAKEDETATSWTTTAIIVTIVAAAAAALLIIYTRTKKKQNKK